MIQVTILGIGNILLSDEGIGVRVAEHLQASYSFPAEVQVIDGGTKGLDLIHYLEVDRLLVVDAVEAGKPPGTIMRLQDDEVPAYLSQKMSMHHIGLADILSIAKLRGKEPDQVVLCGMQPASLEVGTELSAVVHEQFASLVELVLQEVRHWGYTVERQAPTVSPQG